MLTQLLSLTAEDAPRPDTPGELPCHRYRFPMLAIQTRGLAPLADGHIRVEMLYAGICGTDLHLLPPDSAGYVQTSAPALLPPGGRVIGHEGVGRVLAVGNSVAGVRVGAIVAFASILSCGECAICRRGVPNQCPAARLLGMEIDGLFGTVVDVPAALAYSVTDQARHDDDLKALACIEPAGVALLACRNARVGRSDSVVVFGGGPIGVFAAIMSRSVLGAARVQLVEPIQRRRELAAGFCDAVYDVDEYFSAPGTAPDVVIECSGQLANIERAFSAIAPNGRVVLLGRSGAPLVLSAVDHLITQGISIIGSRGHLGVLPEVIALYGSRRLPLGAVITGELESLAALHTALQHPGDLADRHCKLLARIGALS